MDALDIFPEVVNHFYPRKYVNVGGWYSPKDVALDYSYLYLMCHERAGKTDDVMLHTLALGGFLAEYKMPTYFVGKDLLESLLQTDPPEDLIAGDLQWTIPGMTLILPRGAWQDSEGADVKWISFGKLPKNWSWDDPINAFPSKYRIGAVADDILLVSAANSRSATWNGHIPAKYSLKTLQDYEVAIHHPHDPSETGTSEDLKFTKRMSHLAVNFVMYLSAMKAKGLASLEDGSCIRKSSTATPGLWNPNWLGRSYKIPGKSLGGTHASPQMHFRRGHWRSVWRGPRPHNLTNPLATREDMLIPFTFVNLNPTQ